MGDAKCLHKLIAEFLGTWFLTFSILSAITTLSNAYLQVVFVHGAAIFVCALMFGQISGGHFNPAVSFAAALNGMMEWKDFGCYAIAQLLGGICAGALNYGLFVNVHYTGDASLGTLVMAPLGNQDGGLHLAQFFFFEMIGTMFLCMTVLLTASNGNSFMKNGGNFFGPLAIAVTLMFVGFMGFLAYAGVNPAREFGPRLFGAMVFGKDAFASYCWVPIIAPFCGSVAAWQMVRFLESCYE